jgi:exodeoxyribonuclease V alpha subunit
MVQALKKCLLFSYIESSFVRLALKDINAEDEALFLAYLFFASRQGHIAVDIDEEIHPNFEEIDEEIKKQIMKGAKKFKGSPYVIKEGSKFYIQKHYVLETDLLQSLKQRENFCLYPNIKLKYFESSHLLKNQLEAIYKAAASNLLLLTGGPGTGKTYTATNIIKYLYDSLLEEEKAMFEIAIAAPTGKAASHLFTNLTQRLEDKNLLSQISAQTLHSLLQVKVSGSDLFAEDVKMLTADLVIIDESSMIDLSLMTRLFKALKPTSRLILIGDRHQLPPIESGSLFADLCEIKKESVVELDVCLRSELESIIHLSKAIKEGHFDSIENKECFLTYQNQDIENQKIVLKEMLKNNPSNFRVLGSIRKGPLGIEELNKVCLDAFKKKHFKTCGFTYPIMFTKNDYKNAIFNGESGLLYFNERGVAYQIEAKGRIGHFGQFPDFELAYCMSIHKSQGSEFEHVLVVLPENSESFGREILYTAVTRAKKSVSILSHKETLKACLKKENRRLSSVLSRSENIFKSL